MSATKLQLDVVNGPNGTDLGLQLFDIMRGVNPRPPFPVRLSYNDPNRHFHSPPNMADRVELLINGLTQESGKNHWLIQGRLLLETKSPAWLAQLMENYQQNFTGWYDIQSRSGYLRHPSWS